MIEQKSKIVKALYVFIGKPLEFVWFKKSYAPMGWYRIDILKRELKENHRGFRDKFTKAELEEIKKR